MGKGVLDISNTTRAVSSPASPSPVCWGTYTYNVFIEGCGVRVKYEEVCLRAYACAARQVRPGIYAYMDFPSLALSQLKRGFAINQNWQILW